MFNRVGESFLFIGISDKVSLGLNFRTCIAHRDAHPAFLEHQYIIGHIAKGGDTALWYKVNARQEIDYAPLIRRRMGNIQIIRL